MNIRFVFLSFVALYFAGPVHAELYAVVEIESHIPGKPPSEREIHFLSENDLRTGVLSTTSLAADWKSPRDCIKTGRSIESYVEEKMTNLIIHALEDEPMTDEDNEMLEALVDGTNIRFRCTESNIVFDESPGFFVQNIEAHVYLLRYVTNSFSITEMESMESCKKARGQYTKISGRQAVCGRSFQSILYK